MPDHCCVPGCRSNYTKGAPYVSVFAFPKDPQRRALWLRMIPRPDFEPSKRSVVCERHFLRDMVVREDFLPDRDGEVVPVRRLMPSLTKDAYPCRFVVPSPPEIRSSDTAASASGKCEQGGRAEEDKGGEKTGVQTIHWNSLITMQLLELLKQYQESHKNSNFRKMNIWVQMSGLMKRKGHSIPPSEIEKKWLALSSTFEKTLAYNRTHKEKKKCAFFNRLSDLHSHPSSFSAFEPKEPPPVRMTVEVSPFSFSSVSTREDEQQQFANHMQRTHPKGEEPKPAQPTGSSQELIRWLETTWAEWKELERRREEERVQRHNEVMEMMAYLIECSGGNRMR